jgi:hypothetical protein
MHKNLYVFCGICRGRLCWTDKNSTRCGLMWASSPTNWLFYVVSCRGGYYPPADCQRQPLRKLAVSGKIAAPFLCFSFWNVLSVTPPFSRLFSFVWPVFSSGHMNKKTRFPEKFKNRKGRKKGERERRVPERKTVGERGSAASRRWHFVLMLYYFRYKILF